jgi:hypothetical protein
MRGHAEGYGPPDIASLMRALMGATGELAAGDMRRDRPRMSLCLRFAHPGYLLSEADHAK